jgi:hypothetical protein
MQTYASTAAEAAADPNQPIEPECECQDSERCPVHHGYD